jgi:hypothetical protein
VVSFICFHERGFGVPANTFMCMLLHYYRLELHHLGPNAVAQAAILRRSVRATWGWSYSGICVSISSGQSSSPRRRGRRGYGARFERGATSYR